VGTGIHYSRRAFEAVAGRARLEPPENPFACNCIILPGDVAVHLNAQPESPFSLDVDEAGEVCLFHCGERVTEISFPAASDYYHQSTSAGRPYGSMAVLEGRSVLAFFYLWGCEYIKTGETCNFCFQVMADMAGYTLPSASPAEVAEIVEWAIDHAGVEDIQLTAGTRFSSSRECAGYAEILRAIEERVGLDRVPSEIYCYVTAPKDPASVDQLFEAGADRVAHDLHVWDRTLHAKVAPGHARSVGREAQLRALEHIAQKFGPNKAFSAFVAGLEPLESMLEGAEYLAQRGIVPAFSVWMPTPGTTSEIQPPGLEYYRKARAHFADLYRRYQLNPPGVPAGSHVSLCRDIYRHSVDATIVASTASTGR
jgi:hypothetical protein